MDKSQDLPYPAILWFLKTTQRLWIKSHCFLLFSKIKTELWRRDFLSGKGLKICLKKQPIFSINILESVKNNWYIAQNSQFACVDAVEYTAELPDWKDEQKEEQIFFGYIFSPSILKLYQLEQYKTIS